MQISSRSNFVGVIFPDANDLVALQMPSDIGIISWNLDEDPNAADILMHQGEKMIAFRSFCLCVLVFCVNPQIHFLTLTMAIGGSGFFLPFQWLFSNFLVTLCTELSFAIYTRTQLSSVSQSCFGGVYPVGNTLLTKSKVRVSLIKYFYCI